VNSYAALPTPEQARQMVTWIECPAHGFKVGMDIAGRIVGRCPTCSVHAAQAQKTIERGEA
jgi:hypothetical protein